MSSNMDFNFSSDISDPFASLDYNLDDISAVIQVDQGYAMDTGPSSEWQMHHHQSHQNQPSASTSAATSTYHNPYARPNQHSPPQEYYDPNKSREIGSIVSLLQSDSPPQTADPYAQMKFSPPNLDALSSLGNTAKMLPQLGTTALERPYQPGSLAHQLAAPAMQPLAPVMSPPAMYVDTQLSPQYMDSKQSSHYADPSPSVKMETTSQQMAGSQGYAAPRKSSSTKEELLRMLVNMSPSDVEKLKGKDTRPRPAAIATRVTRDQKWSAAEDDLSDGDEEETEGELPVRKGPKTERRTAHNLIEKKYRCSINDRIQHLKQKLAGDDAKLSKSATLRKAIEHIEDLENDNADLRAEVDRLSHLLRLNNVEIPPPVHIQSPALSPSSSSVSMQSPRSVTSPALSPPLPTKGAKRARLDQARLTMFAFMFALLMWNPLSLLAAAGTNAHQQDSLLRTAVPTGGRVLDSNEEAFDTYVPADDWWQSNVIRPGFVWSINIFVVICVLTRLLVYGEPVQDFKSRSWSNFLAVRQRARTEMETGNVREAMRQYMECLQILERPLPSAGLDQLLSVVWQIVRHALNGLWVGRWFARRRRDALKPVTVVCKSHAHTAMIYHKLHQLHLVGVDETYGSVSGLYLALSAVNLAESAGASVDGLPRSVLADIYIAAGIRTRMCLCAPFSKIVSMYFYRRARRHVRRAEPNSVNGVQWMFHPLSRKFLADPKTLESNLCAKTLKMLPFVDNKTDSPISRLRSSFKLHLLSQLSAELCGQTEQELDVVDVSSLLLAISTSGGVPKKSNDWDCDTSLIEGDELCTWWIHVLTCALFWKQGQTERAKKHYTLVRQCPRQLLSNPLSLAVGHAFCGRKLCADDRQNAQFGQLVFIHSRKALEVMRSVAGRGMSEETTQLQEVLRRLAYEWVMSSLLDAWRSGMDPQVTYWTQRSKHDYRTLYQEACNHYAFLSENTEGRGGYRVQVYQLTCRMLNGANPLHTFPAVVRIRKHRVAAVSGRGGRMDRSNQPDPFHLHVLSKLHATMMK